MQYCERIFSELNRMADSPDGERRLARELAGRVAELARAPRMAEIRQRWRDVIALRKPDRPPVWCNPVGCWSELLPESSLVCGDPVCREIEVYCKRLLIKHAIGDDTPINDYYMVNHVFDVSPANTWGVDIEREAVSDGGVGTAWRYKPALKCREDFDRLVVPQYRINRLATEEALSQRADILGDALPVRGSPITGYYSGGTLCQPAADLRGMEPLMMDMIDEPDLAHRLMQVVLDAQRNKLDAIETAGGIRPNNDTAMFLSDPLHEHSNGHHTLQDCWIHGNSQEFDMVGPDMFAEFLLDYQKQVFSRFGAVCYGCCENLTQKLDLVLEIPNLRLITCSAWTDIPTMVDKVGDSCCIMWRHKASDVVFPDDLSGLKRTITEQAKAFQGCYYQVVLRELQTLAGHENRLSEWTKLSFDAVCA